MSSNSYDGIRTTTDEGLILILITDWQSCCETWGYLSSLDNYDDFIDATINSINVVDDALEVTMVQLESNGIDVASCYFVNIDTDKGLLQFTVYNEHNGYYGHDVKVIVCDEVILEGCL